MQIAGRLEIQRSPTSFLIFTKWIILAELLDGIPVALSRKIKSAKSLIDIN